LTPEVIEAVLGDFRSWLQQAAVSASAAESAETQPVDLHTLLSQFTALRHDVNLQTRAVRAQQEQNAATLAQLGEAVQTIQRLQSTPRQDPGAEDTLRPLVKVLIDTRDALALAEPEVRRVRSSLFPALESLVQGVTKTRGLWSRLFGGAADSSGGRESAERVHQLLDSVVTGYKMSLQRLDRAIEQTGLEPISCVGQPFDPEEMEVVAVAADSGQPSGTVVEEVRRGYRWRNRVFRFVQVSVARDAQEGRG
jgi:molecular chaperone GrpE